MNCRHTVIFFLFSSALHPKFLKTSVKNEKNQYKLEKKVTEVYILF